MRNVSKWATRGAEFVAAALLAAMFLTFVLQIFSRYVLMAPFGWTLELCLALWIWIVFWGSAFIVKESDHVRFDLFYLAMPARWRKICSLLCAAAIAVGLLWSLLPTWDYIDFLKIKKSATLKIPMRTIFSIYALFLGVVALRYAWRFAEILRHGPPDDSALAGSEDTR